jgi:FtsP/CotA-like multicopper oxidase with cupredoxin domain
MLVNGAPWPRLEVSNTRYRLRILNASNARNLKLSLEPSPKNGPALLQTGSDGGLDHQQKTIRSGADGRPSKTRFLRNMEASVRCAPSPASSSGALSSPEPCGPSSSIRTGWKDTVNMFAGQTANILVKFEGYRGRYVFHCHNLEHEDMAMMGDFEVV